MIAAKLIPHSLQTRAGRNWLTSVILRAAGVIREAQMTSTDLFRRRANEWRRIAVRARNADDKVFWLGLVERWEAARLRCLGQVLAGDFDPPKQKHGTIPNKKANPA